jgi:predicted unusual protein kinase regulating ubiquinone biosynthesis (AarF/ABC1/UbiB family)
MLPKVAELMAALPGLDEEEVDRLRPDAVAVALADLGLSAVPVNPLRRLWAIGGLQAHVALAYLAYWVRSWFAGARQVDRERAEAHLRAGLKMLATMSYLRGAAMKLGQALANYPEIAETLERLHFEAPPMHFALLRELVHDELGGNPEEVFASFDTEAFAAASLGQVHRAGLASGERAAVKIQYPGIARAIRADFRTVSGLLLPLRLSKAWENLQAQFEDVRTGIERETDYEQEAATLRTARALFREDDQIVVPRVFDHLSTRRVLTMEYLEGTHILDFLATNPSQAERDRYGTLIYQANDRLYYAGRLLYADPHPGNYLFLADGRLGFIDFGCVRPYTDDEWDLCRRVDATVRQRRDVREIGRELAAMGQTEPMDSTHLQLLSDWCAWMWRPYWTHEPFDFGDAAYFREGVDLLATLAGNRMTQGVPMTPLSTRWYLGTVSMLYRLRAQVNVRALYEREVVATGWATAS